MNLYKSAAVFAQIACILSAPAAETVMEPWVQQCSINTSEDLFIDADASVVAGGMILERIRKHKWCKLMAGVEGVLIVHPLSKIKPCKIRYRFGALDARGKTFVFKARGSDVVPGVVVRIESKGKVLKEQQLNKEWEIIEVPATDLPTSTQDISIEIHAVGWNCEYIYIDFIGFR